MKTFILILISVCLVTPSAVQAGKLGDFEESATSKGETTEAPESHDEDDNDDDDDDDRYDYDDYDDDDYDDDNVTNDNDGDVYEDSRYAVLGSSILSRASAHTKGEPAMPLLRLDATYQNVESDVEAIDFRAEAGYGWLALHFNQIHYEEDDTGDELDLRYLHVMFRLPLGSRLEWHMGVGRVSLHGQDENSGDSITSPFIYRPMDWLAVEFRPTWSDINGNSIKDYDLGVHFGRKYKFLKVGYRWIESGDTNLDAAYIGASFWY